MGEQGNSLALKEKPERIREYILRYDWVPRERSGSGKMSNGIKGNHLLNGTSD